MFREGGTVTAGNSSQINDGAACLVVASEEKAKQLGARAAGAGGRHRRRRGRAVRTWAWGRCPPRGWRSSGRGSRSEDIDLVELNEAFAAQVLACIRELGVPHEKLNVNGGAIAIGHPLGASGARLIGTLAHELRRSGKRYGVGHDVHRGRSGARHGD